MSGHHSAPAAAKSSHDIGPSYHNGPFIADSDVKHLLQERKNIDPSLLNQPACVDFKAVGTLGRRSTVLDTMGTAAVVCRHEFPMAAVNMFTEENFVYYDVMLQHIMQQYHAHPDRKLVCFFLDIACQFKGY